MMALPLTMLSKHTIWLVATLSLGTIAAGCARRPPAVAPTSPLPANCIGDPSIWIRAEPSRELDLWCAQVGTPLVVHAAVDSPRPASRLVVLSWNVHVGGARLIELVEWLRTRAAAEGRPVGFVLLLQEAFRARGDIRPPVAGGGIPNRINPVRPALDVEALGRYLRMSVAYVPSMRNGHVPNPEEWEDRGNAILSTEPISAVTAIELPFGGQRRVAVAATITPRDGAPFRAIAAHFDTFRHGRGQRRQAAALADQIARFKADGLPMLLGADTNARRGARDATVTTLALALPLLEGCGDGPSALLGFRFDFLFTSFDRQKTRNCETLANKHGSDHRPLTFLLTLD